MPRGRSLKTAATKKRSTKATKSAGNLSKIKREPRKQRRG
jgi:hypothetical protein